MAKKERLKWKNESRKINDLMPLAGNPRTLSKKQAEDLKKSLEKFNLVEVPAINTDDTIIAGHQRLKILQLLGRGNEKIDVRVPNRKLSAAEVREYNIRSNKNAGGWDYDILANDFEMEDLIEWGFSESELMGGEGKKKKVEFEASNEPKNAKEEIKCPKCGYTWEKEKSE